MLIHITEFLGANIFDDRPFIVMPFLRNGNARDYVYNHPDCDRIAIVRRTYSQAMCLRYLPVFQLHHVSLGLVYLHNNNVMHGDLKAVSS
jgi:serine/threonine protein kinase